MIFEKTQNLLLLNFSTLQKLIYRNSTKVMISDLRPFMLYQFKVRALSNDSDDSPFSETIECYTNEDGKHLLVLILYILRFTDF